MPSTLDSACRELLRRAQAAIDLAVDSAADQAGLPDIVAESTLRQHEWEIAVALRDITDLRAEHELNAAESAGPLTAALTSMPSLRSAVLPSRLRRLQEPSATRSARSARPRQHWRGPSRAPGRPATGRLACHEKDAGSCRPGRARGCASAVRGRLRRPGSAPRRRRVRLSPRQARPPPRRRRLPRPPRRPSRTASTGARTSSPPGSPRSGTARRFGTPGIPAARSRRRRCG